jgi:hypothetical protein
MIPLSRLAGRSYVAGCKRILDDLEEIERAADGEYSCKIAPTQIRRANGQTIIAHRLHELGECLLSVGVRGSHPSCGRPPSNLKRGGPAKRGSIEA